ncbi:hypothetical protein N657DRAFT_573554 [Parathielavia appendiculata]|uniref:Ubiquitin carboxyl-terminal hydrolase 19 n=1 Tax=Parathielavia appendiculata TaxID=2587402 RepID=A0AAN6Z3R4_9PEZI|nr:hypothetical protein N657DRAFT_573554 [Parathielavia appendiculata]
MDPVFVVTREELHDVQMELKRIQHVQHIQGERLRSLEKRQADDAALKSVWNSPFPSVLGGTPQHGPVHMPSTELIDDLDEEGHNLLGTLQLEAEDEPIRRGAASRANSVRFDESALHGANFSNHGGRHSGDFGPIRPGSGLGGHHMMERSYSHKSDGRHSSAGHSVHSMHSGISGRTSSLGLDTTFVLGGHEDNSPLDMPEPPPVLYILGSPPSIIRCWLTSHFTSAGLLYAVVCTGSQKSTVDYSLLRELDLVNNIHRDVDGAHRITLPVFLAEARVTQSNSRSASPAPHLPSITASFEVTGMDQQESPESRKSIRVFIGSHTLRMHGADILLSRNLMTLYGSDRDKLSIPFVRPEDDAMFKHITTANLVPNKPKLNAAAPEFVAGEKSVNGSVQDAKEQSVSGSQSVTVETELEGMRSPTASSSQPVKAVTAGSIFESGAEGEKQSAEPKVAQPSGKETSGSTETNRRESSAIIRTSWRQTAAALGDNSTPLSGYQPAARSRSMKVLRPNKSNGSTTKTGSAYEAAQAPRSSTEQKRKESGQATTVSWGNTKRSVSVPALNGLGEGRPAANGQETSVKVPAAARLGNNPLGSASAFSWIASNKPKAPGAE